MHRIRRSCLLTELNVQCALTFWTAAFPGLARDLANVQESAARVESGDKR